MVSSRQRRHILGIALLALAACSGGQQSGTLGGATDSPQPSAWAISAAQAACGKSIRRRTPL